jgi:segregation and condensation protein A
MEASLLHEVRLPVFEGPLDLLLRLIEREELDITTIALAEVADQYLDHLARLEEGQVGELASFLVVAAKLLLIKSLALLPRSVAPSAETEEAAHELVQQLQAYKQFREVAALLRRRDEQECHSYVRVAPVPRPESQLDLGEVTVRDLLAVVQEVLDAMPAPPVGEVVAPITVTREQQTALIEAHLARKGRVRFRDVLSGASTRVEIIVTFLALLELIRLDRVRVQQERLFGPIFIERRSPSEPAPAAD